MARTCWRMWKEDKSHARGLVSVPNMFSSLEHLGQDTVSKVTVLSEQGPSTRLNKKLITES